MPTAAVHAENMREHRRGLLVDVITDVKVGNDTAWHQVTTFLHQQRTSLSDEPRGPALHHPPPHPRCAARPVTGTALTRGTPPSGSSASELNAKNWFPSMCTMPPQKGVECSMS